MSRCVGVGGNAGLETVGVERPVLLVPTEHGEHARVYAADRQRDGSGPLLLVLLWLLGSNGGPPFPGLERVDGHDLAVCLVENVERLAVGRRGQVAGGGQVSEEIDSLRLRCGRACGGDPKAEDAGHYEPGGWSTETNHDHGVTPRPVGRWPPPRR